jgi:hypothetical protein
LCSSTLPDDDCIKSPTGSIPRGKADADLAPALAYSVGKDAVCSYDREYQRHRPGDSKQNEREGRARH